MGAVRFEKWQALGNDYLILEGAELPFPLSVAAVRRLCSRHLGPGADGVLVLLPPDAPNHVARLRIFNPDGSEAELSGNGAREAILYLRRNGWTDRDSFAIQTAAGEIRPTITSPTTCRVDMGRARLRSEKDFPIGGEDGIGEVAGHRFRHVSIGNPQCAIRVGDLETLEQLDLAATGPPIEHDPRFPNRTNVSFYAATGPHAIRARIFERGVGETLTSGTGASGAAVAHVLDGGTSPVTVHLDGGELTVEIDETLRVHLTGWAVPVYRGELARSCSPSSGPADQSEGRSSAASRDWASKDPSTRIPLAKNPGVPVTPPASAPAMSRAIREACTPDSSSARSRSTSTPATAAACSTSSRPSRPRRA